MSDHGRAATDGRPADSALIDPPYAAPGYGSTALRAPTRPLVPLQGGATERSGPMFGNDSCSALDADLTAQHNGEPVGERITVTGTVRDGDGHPVPAQLVEIWQANAAGRYAHELDRHRAPIDPNFTGGGRALTDADGGFAFTTIKPGAYPWGNHPNAWRPAHIHFSVFGRSFSERLVTQMYFPGDPLLGLDPIYTAVRDEQARARLLATFDLDTTVEAWSLGYRFDIVVGGQLATPAETNRAQP